MALLMIPPPVSIMTMRIVNQLYNIDYPAVYGMQNIQVQNYINQSIYSLVLRMIPELQQLDIPTYISMAYEIKTNERNILSLTIDGLGDFHGAHPSESTRSLTFDTTTGRIYELKDLFKPGSDYIKVLSDRIAREIKEREIPLLGEFKGIKPNQDYYLADKNLIIYFQKYEISPGYVGLPYFSIPIYDLDDIIPDEGLLSRLTMFL